MKISKHKISSVQTELTKGDITDLQKNNEIFGNEAENLKYDMRKLEDDIRELITLNDNMITSIEVLNAENDLYRRELKEWKNYEKLQAFIKHNAELEDIIVDIRNLTASFTLTDHVIIAAGLTNAMRGKGVNENIFDALKEHLRKHNKISENAECTLNASLS
ncbi:hypothetical protein JTB14_018823 [Gonioctena quinquepunctata]|nr:hypothetical protein JTB14_018823 [Gonioctena quinquepunctata]